MTAVDAPGTRLGDAVLTCRAIEELVCDVWRGVLDTEVSPHDDFFDLGGDSLSIIDTVDELRKRGIQVRTSVALRNPTPARLAESLTVGNERAPAPGRTVLPELLAGADGLARQRARSWADVDCRPSVIAAGGSAPPLFLFHSASHRQLEREAALAWGLDHPVLGLAAPGTRGPLPPVGDLADRYLADLADRYLDALVAEQPHGPYRLAGFGHRAVVAYEVARKLRGRGQEVALLAMVAPPAPGKAGGLPPSAEELLDQRCTALARRFALTGREDAEEVLARMRAAGWYDAETHPADVARAQLAWAELAFAVHGYPPDGYDGPTVLCVDGPDAPGVAEAWAAVLSDARVHFFEYGVESPAPVLADTRLGAILRQELAP